MLRQQFRKGCYTDSVGVTPTAYGGGAIPTAKGGLLRQERREGRYSNSVWTECYANSQGRGVTPTMKGGGVTSKVKGE